MLDSGITQAVSPANSKSDTNYFNDSLNFAAEGNHFAARGTSYFALTRRGNALFTVTWWHTWEIGHHRGVFLQAAMIGACAFLSGLTAGSALIIRGNLRPLRQLAGAAGCAGLWLISNLPVYLTGFLKCRNRPETGKNSRKCAERKYEARAVYHAGINHAGAAYGVRGLLTFVARTKARLSLLVLPAAFR